MILKGIYPIVPTPFHDNGDVDFPSIERLIDFISAKGVHGFAIMGALGEGPKLTVDEWTKIVTLYRKKMPSSMGLVVGVRALATDPAKIMVSSARDLGADGILLGPHSVQKDKPLLEYYQQVGAAAEIPCIIHDYPAVNGINMSAELITGIYKTSPNVTYIKLEDPPTCMKMKTLQRMAGDGLKVFGALGGMYALEELELGAVGIMTGFIYAELLVQLYHLTQQNKWQDAANLFYDFLPLNRWEFQQGIGISLRKLLLRQLGVFSTAKVRHPGADADAKTVEQLLRIVRHLNSKGYGLAI
jgi:4-hydroxy-tetrahydrodipicolinate synthase